MKYISVGCIRHHGKIIGKNEFIPDDATEDEINYLVERGAIVAIAPTGEIIDPEETEDEIEDYIEEESEEEFEEEFQEPPEIDVMEGVVQRKRSRRGGK